MDKYEVLSEKIAALYPLRVFMRHTPETAEEHIKECLEVAETTADADYYFLIVECGQKLFGVEMLEKVVNEAMDVASTLYQPAGARARMEGKSELVLKLLAKKFGCLPPETRQNIGEAKPRQLDLIAEGSFDFRDLDDVLRCLR